MSTSTQTSKVATVLRVTSGNFLEMFDFFLFGLYAVYIQKTFFPIDNEYLGLLFTYMTFALSFVVRPIGALILGPYIDRVGRRKGLVVTLSIMALGTVLIAFVPGYASIGFAAPLLVILGRLLQGFSAGVELGGVSVYLSEMATPGRKGFYVAWQSASQQVAIVAGALIGFTLIQTVGKDAIGNWAWRVPFFIGCLIVPLIFIMRRSLQETEEFAQRKHHPTLPEIYRTLANNWGIIIAGVLLVIMTTVSFYLITVYTPGFGKELKLSPQDTLLVTMLVAVSNFCWLPISGALSDRIGRAPILIVTSILAILTAYPTLHWLAAAPSFHRMLVVELWLSFIYGCYNGAMVVALTEIIPPSIRASGFSFAYSCATIIGGSTPAIVTWLIHDLGDKAAPGYWEMFAGVCGLVATLLIYRGIVKAKTDTLLTTH